MSIDNMAENLKLLCSYGRSVSDVCRRAGINRQQFNKYLTGQSAPSLSTLRRICDFFGVEDYEILLDSDDFRQLIRLRPPKFAESKSPLDRAIDSIIRAPLNDQALLKKHEGYYHAHICPDPVRGYFARSLCRIYQRDGNWFSKTIERFPNFDLMLPSTVKYTGVVLEAYHRIVVHEREQGAGQSLWTSMLFASEHAEPNFLSGLILGIVPEGSHEINAMRTVWQYLGKQPDLRQALSQCGLIDRDSSDIPAFVRDCADNTQVEGEQILSPRF